jgi:hypothetical protein
MLCSFMARVLAVYHLRRASSDVRARSHVRARGGSPGAARAHRRHPLERIHPSAQVLRTRHCAPCTKPPHRAASSCTRRSRAARVLCFRAGMPYAAATPGTTAVATAYICIHVRVAESTRTAAAHSPAVHIRIGAALFFLKLFFRRVARRYLAPTCECLQIITDSREVCVRRLGVAGGLGIHGLEMCTCVILRFA